MHALGKVSTAVGLVGIVSFLLGAGALVYALSNGVHCPMCDAHELEKQGAGVVEWWKQFFKVKDALLLAGLGASVLAIPFAKPKRWPFVASTVLAVIVITFTPR